ncbi:hypothetical protein [Desulfospira joergensenii]|uniref:hypothetical protein n=1 Tax=Desulfospira joergensenii TaxID=53329 RepID=UPI0003B4FF58|nr:hypothetical protein [Desulfospira joergensenii]
MNTTSQSLTRFTADFLENDANASGRSTLIQELTDMETLLKRKMDAGVTPDEARKAEVIRQAIDAAKKTVDTIWESKYN